MNVYEVLYIITPELEADATKATVQKFSDIITNNGGTVEKVDEWGRQKLAYEIDYKTEGYYVLVTFASTPEFPTELERNLRIDESILRYMVTRKEA